MQSDSIEPEDTTEAEPSTLSRELATLLEVSRMLGSTLEINELLGVILEQLRSVVEYQAAAVFLLEGTETLRLLRYRGPLAQQRLAFVWRLAEAEHSRQVIYSRQPVIIPDVRADTPLAVAFRHKAIADLGTVPPDIGTWMGVPLILRNEVIGVLAFDHDVPGRYTAHHAALALAFARHAALAIENARLFEQAQTLAALQERQRLARELHDSVSQVLYSIALGARTARALLDRDPAQAAAPIDYVLQLAEAGMAEMRALLFELRPESLASEGLLAALTKQADALRARYSLRVYTQFCSEPALPLEHKQALYRIAQEAIHNCVKHAHATAVSLQLSSDSQGVTLTIQDDGQGFDPRRTFPGHLGLQSMRERATRLKGRLTITSTPELGTGVTVWLPHC